MSKYVIGIDVGGTTSKFGIVDRTGHILEQSRMPTNQHEVAEEFIHDLYDNLQPMIERVGGNKNIVGIGMGAPNFTPGKTGATAALEVEDFDKAIADLRAAKTVFIMDPHHTGVCDMALINDTEGNQIMIHRCKQK